MSKKNFKEQLGSLFINTSKNGVKFVKGTVNGVDVVGFFNEGTRKDGSKVNVINLVEDTPLDTGKKTFTKSTTKKTGTTSEDLPF